jgi:hypothetical protein
MFVFVDESGDLGWKLNCPYGSGGSSRYLTLACMFVPYQLRRKPPEFILSFYRQNNWNEKKERKAKESHLQQKIDFCNQASLFLKQYPDIKICAMTVNKNNVFPHIQSDPNKLYNYMLGLIIPNYIKKTGVVDFCPDERSIKVQSGNSLIDYLGIKLWFEHSYSVTLNNKPSTSSNNFNIQFVDWIAHCVWLHYERHISRPFSKLTHYIDNKQLYF